MDTRPNLIVICIDTLRADCVGPGKGLGFVRTPHMDRLAAESVIFDRCFAEGLPTIQVRRCYFTGKRSYPWRQVVPHEGLQPDGFGWHPIAHEEDTLSEILHDAGYLTALVADTYHMFKPTMNFTRGFLSWQFIRGQENDPYRSGPIEKIDLAAHCPDGEASAALHPTVAQYLLNRLDWKSEEDWLAARVFRTAARWVQDNYRQGPFFLWVDSFSPHELWDPPTQYADAYYPRRPGSREPIYPQAFSGKTMTPEEVERCKALYFGFVTFVDRWVGHLLTTIEALGLFENTVVMLTTDHGTELMDKGQFGKSPQRLFPYNTRNPWCIRTPDGPRGRRCDAWVQTVDLPPTLLALAGAGRDDMDGSNVWPIALGKTPPHRQYVTTGWGENFCVRDDDWAVHLTPAEQDFRQRAVAFDLRNDPGETNDIAAGQPEVVEEAVKRTEALVGRLPADFQRYHRRHVGRTMRLLAPMRCADGNPATP